jgi:chromate transporter
MSASAPNPGIGSPGEVFRVALLLGLTSFGGPIAHIGYFQREYVDRRGWLTDAAYTDIVALSQLLPGPASSQVGMAVGHWRAGVRGAMAAWAGFTLPSAVALTAFALLAARFDVADAGWVHGLKLAAVAIVAAAIVAMWRTLAPDWPRRLVAVAAAAVMLVAPTAALQVAVIAGGALAGWAVLGGARLGATPDPTSLGGRRPGWIALAAFGVLLIGLPIAARVTGIEWLAVVDAFYRAGSLVFGGGHVVLPLLSESVVEPGWVSPEAFLAGYGAAQAVPGPLFTFAAFLGASLNVAPNGVPGAALALAAIFLPSFLLVIGVLPLLARIRERPALRGALAGAGAAVIGLLLAAFYDPVWIGAVGSPLDVALAALAFVALVLARVPPYLVVGAMAIAGELVARLSVQVA